MLNDEPDSIMINQGECCDLRQNPSVQVFVLSRDRVDYIDEALQSIVNQNYDNYEIIVSDNSEHDDVCNLMIKKYPELKYVRRKPCLPVLEHFRVVLDECNKDYTVLFHDDDVMNSEYLTRMVNALNLYPNVCAVGCNARIIKNITVTNISFMMSFSKALILKDTDSFLKPYMGFEYIYPAPFPGYMYRTSVISGLYLEESEGGKYSDVSFLLKLLSRGNILWLPESLFFYRIHSSNDSKNEIIGQRLKLLRYIYKYSSINSKSKLTTEFRFGHWLRWLFINKCNSNIIKTYKFSLVLRFVVIKSIVFAFTRPGMWLRILNQIKLKLVA